MPQNYFRKRLRSFQFAYSGLKALFIGQANARIHLLATIVVLLAAWYFQITRMEWALIVVAIVMVLAAEALNTAIEQLADVVSPERHPRIKIAKDVAAAAVLLLAIGAAIIGLIIFLPRLLVLF